MGANEREKPLVKDLNEHIVCPLCRGYLVDATTLVECLHSFCRGCIVRRLSSGARACPACNVATSPPLLPDPRLQRLVYLVVPGLFRSELERRRHFRLVNPQCPLLAPPLGALDLTLDDLVSLSLCELTDNARSSHNSGDCDGVAQTVRDLENSMEDERETRSEKAQESSLTRYLKCPAGVTVRHLLRLLMLKRGWEEANAGLNLVNRIEMLYEENGGTVSGMEMRVLDLSWTLLDLACIFGWKREEPMKLFYRILHKNEVASAPEIKSYAEKVSKGVPIIENIQRPPTPPPSPSPVQEDNSMDAARSLEPGMDSTRPTENEMELKEAKTKKPRCEVPPVMRAPDLIGMATLQTSHPPESSKSKEFARLEHRKRRKRRNKRVIAEITTTPREDLLKLKVRLTPCPPRITSSTGTGQTKEKLLQMRAVRREKINPGTIGQQQRTTLTREDGTTIVKEATTESEETIEEIIDGIPDEVVRIAQNITTPVEENTCSTENQRPTVPPSAPRIHPKIPEEAEPEKTKIPEPIEQERPKKDEEILRRLGLVAINEANESIRDKSRQRAPSNIEKINSLEREKLEKQLRESKANRVRSLLAEKQMRDALKSIMSKTKEENASASSSSSSSIQPGQVAACPKKKGPPPLAPLRVAKPTGGFSSASSAILRPSGNVKYEIPLDLSSAGTVHDNVLDLSATLSSTGVISTSPSPSSSSTASVPSLSPFSTSSSPSPSSSSSSSSTSSASSSSSSPSSCSVPALSFSRPPRAAVPPGSFLRKTKELEQRRGQDTNLRTLSDAAVSLLSGCAEKAPVEPPLLLNSSSLGASKVALRIPQPHQRISGFGMKIKPNLSIRHIPNPQAVVASQYRNQRASYFNAVSQQPP